MENNEFKDMLVSINRITKVVKGGRRFTFSALVVVGNYAGSIGVGYANAPGLLRFFAITPDFQSDPMALYNLLQSKNTTITKNYKTYYMKPLYNNLKKFQWSYFQINVLYYCCAAYIF